VFDLCNRKYTRLRRNPEINLDQNNQMVLLKANHFELITL
jgi:hypothetical protein